MSTLGITRALGSFLDLVFSRQEDSLSFLQLGSEIWRFSCFSQAFLNENLRAQNEQLYSWYVFLAPSGFFFLDFSGNSFSWPGLQIFRCDIRAPIRKYFSNDYRLTNRHIVSRFKILFKVFNSKRLYQPLILQKYSPILGWRTLCCRRHRCQAGRKNAREVLNGAFWPSLALTQNFRHYHHHFLPMTPSFSLS